MKKLMIVAAAASLAGVAMAEPCGELKCPFVYRIKLAGKTVTGLNSASNKTACLDGKCWVKPTTLRIAGYFYGEGNVSEGACGDVCECKAADAYVANNVFWDANKREVKFDSVAFDIFEILRNSGAQNKAQILLKLDDLNLAGFGAYNPTTGNLKSANGFFAGKLPAAKCQGAAGPCGEPAGEAEDALVFAPCTLDDGVASTGSIAFGRWNLAYKSDKVAKAQAIAAKYGAEGVWATPGLVLPTAFVAAQ